MVIKFPLTIAHHLNWLVSRDWLNNSIVVSSKKSNRSDQKVRTQTINTNIKYI